jgi:predicted ATP-dependent endonuclease of OLD family
MQLQSICIKNFRRLKDVKIDVDVATTIFVGANNSGKTSATHVLKTFLDGKNDFSLYDFSANSWELIEEISNSANIKDDIQKLPSITLDLWFKISEADLTSVIELLPGLDWSDAPVGVRLEYCPKNTEVLLSNYQKLLSESLTKKKESYQPWPISLSDYLIKKLKTEYDLRYYVLDFRQFDTNLKSIVGYIPRKLGDENERTGSKIIRSLIKIDFLNAQRHLTDTNSTGRAEDLSKRLNRFYERNLDKREHDIDAMKALSDSETQLTNHLTLVFEPTIKSLNKLGYPGFANPKLIIKASLNFESVSQNAKLHYSLGKLELPDKYNGLGFKNLIYMVIEVLDFHERWIEEKDNRPPLHLIVIEEPEAHLHAQLQQVFIKQIWNIISGSDTVGYNSQLILTTHSPHIIYESGFGPIRYFHRCSDINENPISEILNLSTFYKDDTDGTKEFLQRYMKLIHCDLFFADAAILVEGNVERLLLPLMIDKCAAELQTNYLSVIDFYGKIKKKNSFFRTDYFF